jgi:ABC-type transport system involved in Fe-S cluster assembly fused permease/ATPase subunit
MTEDTGASGARGKVTREEKIHILMSEYASLRLESVTRGNTIPTIVSIGIAALAFVVTSPVSHVWKAVLFVALFVLVGLVTRLIHRDIQKAASRLRMIEADVNARAGEELLLWETRYAAGQRGFFTDLWPKHLRYDAD